jgi:ribose 5-phosphate isomerase B
MKPVAIACDHAGSRSKEGVKHELEMLGLEVLYFGTNGIDSVDYPDYAAKVVEAIEKGVADMGVLICGSGIGMSIAANRSKSIRAALCHNEETARLSRQHNNANVLVLGSRIVNETVMRGLVRVFFSTPFEGGRHQQRIDKMS